MSFNYKELYKRGVDTGEQQKKRQIKLLTEQKLRRQRDQDENRLRSTKLSFASSAKPLKQKSKQKQHNNFGWKKGELPYRLQLSEWLRHTPDELSDWLLVPCPIGKRYLVVASRGRTKVYNKGGWQVMQIQTMLPGDGLQAKCTTILDCIYVEVMDTFYVLDAIAFGLQDLQECEASFRLYWLKTRFGEYPVDLGQCSNGHEKAFILVKPYDFDDLSSMEEMLQKYPIWKENQPQLDGFLFYHKEASYVCGPTPLVCWLFAFMLPDLLGIKVNNNYKAPDDYQSSRALEYMDEFDRKLKEQKKSIFQKHESKQKPIEMELQEENESDEDASLKSLLDHERRLELGELDMDSSETNLSPAALQPPAAAACAASMGC